MKNLSLFVLACGLAGCSSQKILKDQDYLYSLNAYRSGDTEKALEEFPKKERGGFITSVEKSWIQIWDDKPEVEALQKQVKTFEDRKFTSVTREAQYFLFQESEEGYVPSEHEVITLHLISAMAFMRLNRWEEAEVEARRAGYFLQGFFNENQPHFDDPALRLWLAGIWTALGDWNAAQVDLRRAAELSKNKELKKLAESKTPQEFSISFSGLAPEMLWVPSEAAPQFLHDDKKPEGDFSFSSAPWFSHHLERNTVLRDSLVKSNYMAQYLQVKIGTVAERGFGKAAKYSWLGAGLVLGGALIVGTIYVLAQTGASGGGEAGAYLLAPGFFVILAAAQESDHWETQYQKQVDEDEKKGMVGLRTYRLVRFLPEWVTLSLHEPKTSWRAKKFALKAPRSKTRVNFINQF